MTRPLSRLRRRAPPAGEQFRWIAAALSALTLTTSAHAATPSNETRTARYYEQIKGQPVPLALFLRAMPKGGDLHNHLGGAIYAESMIAWAAQDGRCVNLTTYVISGAPCAARSEPVAQAIRSGSAYHDMVDAFSMRDFVAHAGESGHDHFFATFDKFGEADEGRDAESIAEAANRAAEDHLSYLELMWSPGMIEAAIGAAATPWTDDFDAQYAKNAPKMVPIIAKVRAHVDETEAKARKLMGCDTPAPQAGCAVTVRYIAQVIRTFPPQMVFAQSQFGFALVSAEPRFVGVNLVAPEDDPITLRDYDKQMRMLGWLGKRYPAAPLTLHAGEVIMGLVPTADLHFHIREAVEVAGARRIGHGVDVKTETDAAGLLREMAAKKVLVEINLTSNDVILGVSGADHPFQTYRAAGVPLALSTDDEGVSRIDLTHEFERAVRTYPLSYGDLKTLVRNSLDYSFAGGDSLWASNAPYRVAAVCAGVALGSPHPTARCKAVLDRSLRARLEWKLEGDFAAFEATDWKP
jgi:adenosine deaminase